MTTKYSTKVIYKKGNSCGGQYAPGNVCEYGTKWKIKTVNDDYRGLRMIGTPELLSSNWDIDESKLEATERFFERCYN